GDMFHGSNPKGYALAGGIVYLILILMIDPIFLLPLVVNFLLGQAMTLVTYRKRSEEHTSELQSRENLVCRLLLEKKKTKNMTEPDKIQKHSVGVQRRIN